MSGARLVTFDAETFYDLPSKYSLSSMSATAYIRDRRFQEIGWSVRVSPTKDDGKPRPTPWYSAKDYAAMSDWLRSFEMEREGTYAITQNGAAFDYMILSWKHGIVPWMCLDTLVMARVLYGRKGPGGEGNSLAALARYFGAGEKGTEVVQANGMRLEDFTGPQLAAYGRYCSNDTELTEFIARKMIPEFTPLELRVMSIIAKMSANARIVVDVDMCRKALVTHREHRADMLVGVASELQMEEAELKSTLMSNPKFAGLLEDLGVEPPMKISKTTGKPTFAFAKNDPEMLEMLESDDPLLADVVGLRTGVKSTQMETRLQHFIAVGEGGPMPAGYRYGGAHTGRAAAEGSIHKCQLHNLPSRGKEGKRNALRMSLTAPKGMVMCGADSSQIEVRVMAANAGEESLLEAFAEGRDPYINDSLCIPLFGRPITKADKPLRDITKAAVLAAQFGQGAKGFLSHCHRNGVEIDEKMAQRTIDVYRQSHTAITRFWRECATAIKAMAGLRPAYQFGTNGCLLATKGWLRLPSGRRMEYRDIQQFENKETGFTEFVFYEKHRGIEKYIYAGRLAENITQAVAYDVVAYQSTLVEDETGDHPIIFTHDELVYLAPEDKVGETEKLLVWAMTQRPSWLPEVALECEFQSGRCYADV